MKQQGNDAFKAGEYVRAIAAYKAACKVIETQEKGHDMNSLILLVACHSNRCLAHYNLQQYKQSVKAANDGLVLAKKALHHAPSASSPASDSSSPSAIIQLESLREKLQSRLVDADLAVGVAANNEESQQVSPTHPTCIKHPRLIQALQSKQECKWAVMGEYVKVEQASGGPIRFIATPHILNCISVFAWHRDPKTGMVRVFCAHANVGNILRGCLMLARGLSRGGGILPELTETLRSLFSSCHHDEVHVSLVGGHAYSDDDMGLKRYFPNDKRRWTLSAVLMDAIHKAGLGKSKDVSESKGSHAIAGAGSIDCTLLNRFNHDRPISSMQYEAELYRTNNRFIVAAIHMDSGRIMTHTDYEANRQMMPPRGTIVPAHVLQYEREVMSRQRLEGSPVVQSSLT